MAASEARGPIAIFVGFLMVSLGITLWKPQPQTTPAPAPSGPPAVANLASPPAASPPAAPAAPSAPAAPAPLPPAAPTPSEALASRKPAPDTAAPPSSAAPSTPPKAAALEPAAKEPDAKEPDAKEPTAKEPPAKEPPAEQSRAEHSPDREASAREPAATQQAAKEPPAGAGLAPHFDVVRVEPTGEAVIAGKGDPNATIELLGQGKVLGEARADAGGNFVIVPPALAPGSYDLSLRQATQGGAAVESTQSVAVQVPQKGGNVVVALAEPGQPTKVLTAPPAAKPPVADPEPASPPAAAAPASVAIRSVELENGNGFFATGTAKPGSPVRIYLNDAHIADIVTAPDGQWSLTLKKGLIGGHYVVRADIGAANATGKPGDVVARAEVPFDVPVAMAEAAKPAPADRLAADPAKAQPAKGEHAQGEAAKTEAAKTETAKTEAVQSGAATADATQVQSARAEPANVDPAKTDPAKTDAAKTDAATADPGKTDPAISRSEVARADPAQGAATTATASPAAVARPSPGAANAVIAEIDTAVVVPGDNLWNISRTRLGHGRRFTQIYAANTTQIRDPRLIYPGQVLVVPPR